MPKLDRVVPFQWKILLADPPSHTSLLALPHSADTAPLAKEYRVHAEPSQWTAAP